jgi:hypothetical protein
MWLGGDSGGGIVKGGSDLGFTPKGGEGFDGRSSSTTSFDFPLRDCLGVSIAIFLGNTIGVKDTTLGCGCAFGGGDGSDVRTSSAASFVSTSANCPRSFLLTRPGSPASTDMDGALLSCRLSLIESCGFCSSPNSNRKFAFVLLKCSTLFVGDPILTLAPTSSFQCFLMRSPRLPASGTASCAASVD